MYEMYRGNLKPADVLKAIEQAPAEQISAEIGAHVLGQRDWKVNLRTPDLWLNIEIVNGRALVCTRRLEGPGGLPVGTSGKGVVLLSGGIDSPLAAAMMMTRGLRLFPIHFHSAPYTSTASQEKVRDLVRALLPVQPSIDLLMIPFADPVQREIVRKAPAKFRVLLYRRFMLRLAELAARRVGAKALVTGE